jgi:predicted AAA+ superfamily ATPase
MPETYEARKALQAESNHRPTIVGTTFLSRHDRQSHHHKGLRDSKPSREPETVEDELETFVVNEIAKQRTWASVDVELHHFCDRDGAEVDLVLEARDGRVVALEVKATATVSREDFRWLELVRNKLGGQFVHGAVLYTGSRALPFGDRLSAFPISVLWETDTSAEHSPR